MNERFARAGAIAHVDLAHEPEFTLGVIRIPTHCELVGAGWSDTLEPRVMQVLVALARAHGEVVSRDDLIEACWEGRIVGEDSIGRCIARLRKSAEASGAFVIETVSRVGYRLKIAEAGTPASNANGSIAPEAGSIAADRAAPPPEAQASLPVQPLRSIAAVAAGILVVLTTGIGIWWLRPRPAAPPAEPATSVAVLPFVNMSGDPAKEYFSDGFSEELLNDLSADPRLRVVARTSAFAFKGRNGDTQAIARALHVHAIVEGSVREARNRVRITAQLIDAGNGYNIWSASFNRNLSDILSVQEDVARAVAIALTHRIVPDRASARRTKTVDPAVYRLYLEGEQQLNLVSPTGFTKAYVLLRQVAAREPDFAPGLAAFSRAAWGAVPFDLKHYDSMAAAAKEAAAKALWLDPGNIEAREMHLIFSLDAWDWRAAASEIRMLRSENPNNMRALAGLNIYYSTLGFPDEALAVLRHAQVLDPLSDNPKGLMLRDLIRTNRYRESVDVARAILAHRPDDLFALGALCWTYAYTGRIGEAREVYAHIKRVQQDPPLHCEFPIDVNSGDVAGARRIVGKWAAEFPDGGTSAPDIAEHYVILNDFDKASEWFERAYGAHDADIFESPSWPPGANYRKTARWQALIRQPKFRQWQAEHDRIAAELAARGGAP